MTLWNGRTLDFWCSYISGHPVHIPYLLDFLLIFAGPLSLGMNIISEIARFAV